MTATEFSNSFVELFLKNVRANDNSPAQTALHGAQLTLHAAQMTLHPAQLVLHAAQIKIHSRKRLCTLRKPFYCLRKSFYTLRKPFCKPRKRLFTRAANFSQTLAVFAKYLLSKSPRRAATARHSCNGGERRDEFAVAGEQKLQPFEFGVKCGAAIAQINFAV